jgi:hypothetical protein
MKFQPNIGLITRVLYVVAGFVFLGLAWLAPSLRGNLAVVVGLLGVIVVVEGVVGF